MSGFRNGTGREYEPRMPLPGAGLGDAYGPASKYPVGRVTPQLPPTQAPVSAQAFGLAERLTYLDVLMRPGMAPTRNEPAFTGDLVGASTAAIAFYTNLGQVPVALRAVGDSLTNTVRLTFYRDAASLDTYLDYLSSVGTVRNETNQILVLPGKTVYVRKAAGVAMDSTDVIRKLVVDLFDPLQEQNWLGLAK